MLASTDRILTTHVGSLPRSEALANLLIAEEAGEAIDKARLAREIERATAEIIAKQVKEGVDHGNDGEQSRVGFQTYVPGCMCGLGGEWKRPPASDQIEFSGWVKQNAARFPHGAPQAALRNARVRFQLLAFAVPALLMAWGISSHSAWPWVLAVLVQAPGLIAERWVFFAQANHPQNLYYQVVS